MDARRVTAVGACLAMLGAAPLLGATPGAQRRTPQVEMVSTLGCVEQEDGVWWLARAAEPTVTRPGVFNETHVAEAEEGRLGTGRFELIGVADFLTAEGLLRSGDRALFTTPDQVNATGQLRDGRTVLVKGLLIETDAAPRINLVAVVGIEDRCGR